MAVESPDLIPTYDVEWTDPKTDWVSTDKFNYSDYNRIKNNLMYLQYLAADLNRSFEVTDLGDDIDSYEHLWTATEFNALETVLDAINDATISYDIGSTQTFESNGPFIMYTELIRIEEACLNLYTLLLNLYTGRRTLTAVLGFNSLNYFMNTNP